jgi:hydroxymethylbilane synthase
MDLPNHLPNRPLRLGTRGSPLAVAQAHLVQAALASAAPTIAVEIVTVVASGDRILDRPLAEVGGKALWTKELDAWLASGEIDFAVHSMKDVETIRPDAFVIAAMLERADVRDRLVGAESLAALPSGAVIGTSAPRRTAQLRRIRPDLNIILFRGNVQTRLAKLAQGDADATLLAAAGLDRLNMQDIGAAISTDVLRPAPSQGAVGIEALAANHAVCGLLNKIDHRVTHQCVAAERALLAALNADCQSPVGALAEMHDGQITLNAEILTLDGRHIQTGTATFAPGDMRAPHALAVSMLTAAHPVLRAVFG